MAGAVELATAYLALVPSLKGASESIKSQLAPATATSGAAASESLGSALLGGLSKFAAPIAGVVAAFSVGKLVKDSVKDFQDYTGAVNGFARIAGGSIQQASGLRAAIQLSGTDTQAAQGSLTIFSKKLEGATGDSAKTAEMVKTLGTNFLDASGHIKPMSDILPGVADKFKSMPDGAEKTALAMQLFGKSGTAMLPFLNQGSEGIAKLTGQAGKMGLVLDDTDKKIFGASKASIREYTTSVQGLHIAIGSTVLPVMTAFGNLGRSFMIPIIQALAGAFSAGRGPMMSFAATIQHVADWIRASITGIIALIAHGDVTDGLAKSLHLFGDSKIIEGFINLRQHVIDFSKTIKSVAGEVATAASHLWAGLTLPADQRAGMAGQLTGFVAFGAGLRATFEGIAGPVKQAFGALMPAIGPLIPQVLSLVSSFSPFSLIMHAILPVLPQIGAALGQLAAAVGGALSSALQVAVPALTQVAGVIVGALGQAVTSVLPALVSLIPVIAQAFGQLVGAAAGLIVSLAPLVAQLLPVLVQVFASIIPVVVNLVTSILPPLIQIVVGIVNAIAPLIVQIAQLLIPIIQALMPVVVTVFGVIASVIQAAMQIVQGIIQVVTGIISGNWDEVWTGIQNIFAGIWNTIGAILSGAWAYIVSLFNFYVALIGVVWTAAWNGISSFFSGIWEGLKSSVSDGFTNIWSFFTSLPEKIGGFFAGAGQWLWDAGKNIVEGLLNGIKSLAGTIGNFFLDLMPDWIKEPFKLALGIHSPSRVFHGFGQNITQGLIGGVSSMRSEVSDTMGNLVAIPDVPTVKVSAAVAATAPAARVGAGVPGSAGSAGTVELGASTVKAIIQGLAEVIPTLGIELDGQKISKGLSKVNAAGFAGGGF